MNSKALHPIPQAAAPAPSLTVYFDGACPVCSKEIAYYQRQAGAQDCEWIDASRCTDAQLGADLSRETALGKFHVRHPDGKLTSGMGGFAALWRVLPKTAWLGRIASLRPIVFLLEQAYRVFLAVRPLWRPAAAIPGLTQTTSKAASTAPVDWPAHIIKELRSDHAGEVGAVQIYRGMLAVSRNADLRAFAQHHLSTEQAHLLTIESHLPQSQYSRLLGAWRIAGWLTGALPALFGPRAAYATVAAVETFVNQHYAEQIAWIDAQLLSANSLPDEARSRLSVLRTDLERCRLDELQHRDEALDAGAANGWAIGLWTGLVGRGSASAVSLARRV